MISDPDIYGTRSGISLYLTGPKADSDSNVCGTRSGRSPTRVLHSFLGFCDSERAAMAEPSREFLDQPSRPSILETLILKNTDSAPTIPQNNAQVDGKEKGRPLTTAVPKSQVLGKVKDFLGIMAKANEKLEGDAQANSCADYDIEVLSGNEKEYIEMDLLLGVADLHTADAVAAAEATISGLQPTMNSVSCGSSDTEDDSGDDNDSGNEDMGKLEKSNPENDESMHKNKPNKRPKIVVLN